MAEVIRIGPLFDGRARVAVHEALNEIKAAVAKRTYDLVQVRLETVLQNPTGYYQSRIRISPAPDGLSVNDDQVIYGPWLEGTSSRNKTTRFKGYHTFRTVTQQVQREVPVITERVLATYLWRMN
jgi:hypothetical protein